ncbi:TlpA disulfide reductase family protein [Flavihumibacter sp.]|uniref:TlpA disulfide reductase family protein n=1 Tax=Flavihumibacter sp. TaxID=1913981 RepID=UPI002FC8BED4
MRTKFLPLLSIRFLYLAFLTVGFISPVFAQTNNFSIKGNIEGLADKSLVYLTDPDQPGDTIARTISDKSRFELKGELLQTKLYNIVFLPADKKALVFLDPKNVSVTGDINKIQQFKFSGSPAHDGFILFQKRFDPLFKRYASLSETASRTGVNDSLMTLYKGLVNEMAETGELFARENQDKEIAAFMWATTMQVVNDINRVEKSFEAMSESVKQGFYGKFIAARIAESRVGRVGFEAMDFIQDDTSGNPVALSSFRGKYVLVDFWASWCGPCRQENPNVVSAFNRFRDKNFTVLGISLDRDKKKWLQAIEADKLKWTQLSDLKFWQNAVAVQYKVQSIPQNLLIDPKGIIVAKNLRGTDLHDKLCELLGGCN